MKAATSKWTGARGGARRRRRPNTQISEAGKPLRTAKGSPREGKATTIVAGKKCDTLFGVGVEGAMRQFGLPARLRRQTTVFVLKLANTAPKSRNSNERKQQMPCFLKRTTLTPGIRTPKRKAGENSLARVSQLGVFHLPSRTQVDPARSKGSRASIPLVF